MNECYTELMDTNTSHASQEIPSTPVESKPPQKSEKINSLNVVVGVLFFILIFVIGYLYMQNQQLMNMLSDKNMTKEEVMEIPTTTIAVTNTPFSTPRVEGKIYSSKTEKITFNYPANWLSAKPTMESNHPDADVYSIQDSKGTIQINWISAIDGFGGACDPETPIISDGCPIVTILDSSPIEHASGLNVISAIISRDGTSYTPWMAVQDSRGLKSTGRQMVYDLFQGKNNSSVMETKTTTNAIFSMKVLSPNDKTLTKEQATAFFTKPEVIQAKQILLSLSY